MESLLVLIRRASTAYDTSHSNWSNFWILDQDESDWMTDRPAEVQQTRIVCCAAERIITQAALGRVR